MKSVVICLSVFVLLFVVTVNGKTACCGPKQFKAGNGGIVGQVTPSNGAEGFYTYIYGAFDFTQRTFGFYLVTSYPDDTTSTVRIIQKYAEETQWIIKDDVKYCAKQTPLKPEPTICIPANASYVMTAFVGGADQGLWVDTWSYNFVPPKDPISGKISVSVTSDTCRPVGSAFIGDRYDGSTGVPFVSTAGIMNMTLGIPEPDKWFTVPDFCKEMNNRIADRDPEFLPDFDHFNLPKFF